MKYDKTKNIKQETGKGIDTSFKIKQKRLYSWTILKKNGNSFFFLHLCTEHVHLTQGVLLYFVRVSLHDDVRYKQGVRGA